MNKIFTWTRPGALGDIITTMNLLKNFRAKHPDSKIVYRCETSSAVILHDLIKFVGFDDIETGDKVYGKEIRLIGYPIRQNEKNPGNHPHEPMKKHLIEYYADELEVEPDVDSFFMPKPAFSVKKPFITMQTTAGWSPYKNWENENWNLLCWNLRRAGIPVYQIGGPNDVIIPNAMGKISGPNPAQNFNTCLTAIANAEFHIGVDSWANHATNIQWEGKGRTKGIILWGSSQITATGYETNINISKNLPCSPCFREDPKISTIPLGVCPNPLGQTYEHPKHKCMADITVEEVYDKVIEAWETKGNERRDSGENFKHLSGIQKAQETH